MTPARLILAVGLGLAAPAAAAPTLSVAAGPCRDTDLVQVQAAFSSILAERLGADAVEPRQFLARLRPAAPESLEEFQRQLEGAQTRFYSGQHEAALAQVREVIDGLERTTPSERSWKVLAAARALQGVVFRASGKKELAKESFRRVLRVAAGFSLDTNRYSPSTISAFEEVRKELKSAKRVSVTVLSQPAGATVFLDGAPVGTTPLTSPFAIATYALAVSNDGATSFPRTLKVDRETTANVDLTFEGSLSPQMPLCLNGEGDEAQARALKLAALAPAQQLVLLRLVTRDQRPDWLEAVLLDVEKAARIRAGGMRLVSSRQAGSLDALATYVLTGQGKGTVVSSDAPLAQTAPLTGTPTRSLGTEPSTAGDSKPVAELPAAPAPIEARIERPHPRGPGPRIAGVVLIGAGVINGVAGVATFAAGVPERDLLEALLDPQGQLPPPNMRGREEAQALTPKVEANSAATIALTAGGGALAIAGAVLAIFFGPERTQVGVAVTPSRAAVTLSGQF